MLRIASSVRHARGLNVPPWSLGRGRGFSSMTQLKEKKVENFQTPYPGDVQMEWPKGVTRPEEVSTRKPIELGFVTKEELREVVDLDNVEIPKVNEDVPDFDNAHAAHGSKSFPDLTRAIAVLNLCRIGFLVEHSAALINFSYKILGKKVTNALLKPTFYGHFCAGEDSTRMQPKIDFLRSNGIESILDYCAENAPDSTDEEPKAHKEEGAVNNQPARVYEYSSEKQCDAHRDIFLSCISAVRDVSPKGFAALKVTALGHPMLLERMSRALNGIRNLFLQFDINRDGLVTRDEFEVAYRSLFVDANDRLPELLERLDPNKTDSVDFIAWSSLLTLKDLPRLTAQCRKVGPLSLATPSEEELKLMDNMHARANAIAMEAAEHGTKVLFDAEQSWYQPAIDNLVLELQRKYNHVEVTDTPIVFNTYQCYLKDTPSRLMVDVDRSKRFNYHFAAKMVRGAYMNSERDRAKEEGVESPIRETIQDTHECYDWAMEYLLKHFAAERENGCKLEVMCATHNQQSIEKTLNLMKEFGVKSTDGTVHFAQLLGMSDNLSFILGKNGYNAYKYLPYGEVDEAIPYLLRRAVENRDMLKNNKKELSMLYTEMRHRTNIFGSS